MSDNMAEEKEVDVHGPGLLGCDCLTGCANCGGKEEWKGNRLPTRIEVTKSRLRPLSCGNTVENLDCTHDEQHNQADDKRSEISSPNDGRSEHRSHRDAVRLDLALHD
jgi:hypothetical protein